MGKDGISVSSRKVRNDVDGYVAWGKFGKIVTDNPMAEPGEVWFTFAETAEAAEAKVLKEIRDTLN